MAANYLAETDRLEEAGKILRGDTRKLAQLDHLEALRQLVREAYELLIGDESTEPVDLRDWLREAKKIL